MRYARQLSTCSRRMAHTSVAKMLGLEAGAPKDALRQAYLRRIKELHPDSGGSSAGEKDPAEFIQLQQSWEQFEKVGAGGGSSSQLQYEETVTFEVETVSTRKDVGRPEDCVWTAQHMAAMRSSVVSAVQSASRQLHVEGEELAPPTLRRCEPSRLRPGALNIHLAATDPWHRNCLAATLGSNDGTTFSEHLSGCFAAAPGGRPMKLRLKGHVRWHTSGGGSQRLRVRE